MILCPKCGLEKGHGERDCYCRQCRKEYRRKHYEENKERHREQGKEWLAARPNYERDRARRSRELHPERDRAAARRWRENNPNAQKEASLRYIQKDPARWKEIRRRLRAKHRDKLTESKRAWREKNPDRVRDTYRKYLEANPGLQEIKNNARRARMSSATGEFSNEDIQALISVQQSRCAGCGEKLKKTGKGKYHIDHVMPLSRGGGNDPGNLQLLCPPCNFSKGARLPEQWAAKIGRLFT